QVLEQVAGSDVPVQIGYNRRFDAGFVAARAAVRGGELGRLHTVRSTTLDPAPPPAAYIAASGGIFRDCSVHDFDIIRWVTGREVTEVYAAGANRGADYIREAGDADTTGAILTLDDGTLAVVSNSRHNARGYDVRMELHGFEDSIAVGLEDKLPLRSVEPGVTFPSGTPHDFFMDRFTAAYRAELTAFTEVVAGSRPSPCTIEAALEAGGRAAACPVPAQGNRPATVEEGRRAWAHRGPPASGRRGTGAWACWERRGSPSAPWPAGPARAATVSWRWPPATAAARRRSPPRTAWNGCSAPTRSCWPTRRSRWSTTPSPTACTARTTWPRSPPASTC